MIALHLTCIDCNTQYVINVNQIDLDKWRTGRHNIQDVMAYLSPGQRDLLVSGICSTCFDNLFKISEVILLNEGGGFNELS